MAPTLKTLVQMIGEISLAHPAVNSFGSGENHLLSTDGATNAVHVWLVHPLRGELINQPNRSLVRRYNLSILVLDIPNIGNHDQELDCISRADMIASYIALRLRENPPTVLSLSGDVNMMSLTNYHGDLWCGVSMELSVITPLPIGACDVRKFE